MSCINDYQILNKLQVRGRITSRLSSSISAETHIPIKDINYLVDATLTNEKCEQIRSLLYLKGATDLEIKEKIKRRLANNGGMMCRDDIRYRLMIGDIVNLAIAVNVS